MYILLFKTNKGRQYYVFSIYLLNYSLLLGLGLCINVEKTTLAWYVMFALTMYISRTQKTICSENICMLPRQKRPPLSGESQEDNVRRVEANLDLRNFHFLKLTSITRVHCQKIRILIQEFFFSHSQTRLLPVLEIRQSSI